MVEVAQEELAEITFERVIAVAEHGPARKMPLVVVHLKLDVLILRVEFIVLRLLCLVEVLVFCLVCLGFYAGICALAGVRAGRALKAWRWGSCFALPSV